MKRKLSLRRSAENDAVSAADYYESEQNGLGLRFHDEVAVTLRRIESNPFQFPASERPGIRKAVINTFPYAIYFQVFPTKIFVIAVHDCRSDPRRWQERVS